MFRSSTTFGNSVTDDASAYLDHVERPIMAVWKLPPNANGLKVVLRMRLERSGRVTNVRVEKSSGDKQFDASAVQRFRPCAALARFPRFLNRRNLHCSAISAWCLIRHGPCRSSSQGKRFDLSQSGGDDVEARRRQQQHRESTEQKSTNVSRSTIKSQQQT